MTKITAEDRILILVLSEWWKSFQTKPGAELVSIGSLKNYQRQYNRM